MKIQSSLFGIQEIDPESTLTFPRGVAGFENCTRFKLFHDNKVSQPIVHYLQSLDDPDLALSLVDPATFGLNYELLLTDEETDLLKLENTEHVLVMLVAYRAGEKPAGQNVAANINGPIILNTQSRIGLQKVLAGVQPEITLKSI